jgi:membrane-bound lytic murein transglycosylase D
MRYAPISMLVIGWLLLASGSFGESRPTADLSTLRAALAPEGPQAFCGEKVPLEQQEVKERFEKEMLLSLWDRPQVFLWLKRSRRFFPLIEKQLSDQGMPKDLKYLTIVESALLPHAGSDKGAMGFWQLLPETARRYGLTVDEYVDERRNIDFATRAALDYLKSLYEKLGSWTLAAAAYNMGEEGLVAEMLEQGIRDYYRLYLPLETQRFILRIVSAKLIMTHPDRYGFHLDAKDYYPALDCDEIQIDSFQEAPLRLVAQAAGTSFKVIKDLNPELRGHYLAPGSRRLRIPKGAAAGFLERYQPLLAKDLKDREERMYVVRQGDHLSGIAGKFDVPLAALLIWNRLDIHAAIHPGDRLVIYPAQLPGSK